MLRLRLSGAFINPFQSGDLQKGRWQNIADQELTPFFSRNILYGGGGWGGGEGSIQSKMG